MAYDLYPNKIKRDNSSEQRVTILNILKYCSFLLIVSGYLSLAQTESIKEGGNGNLVSVRWLEKNINNENILILDASPGQVYKTKHIAGAISDDIFSYGPKEMPHSEIEKRYQSWGISLGKKIVIYDQGGTFLATRLFFSLYYYGYPVSDLFVLDGELSKWIEEGLPVTEEITPAPEKGTFTITRVNENAAAKLSEFLTASGNLDNNVLLEALDQNWHYGGLTFFDKPGHIPNAILTPSSDYFNEDKTFKSPEEIERMMKYFTIKQVIGIFIYLILLHKKTNFLYQMIVSVGCLVLVYLLIIQM